MRDARGNESFGTFTEAFENSGERVHLQNSPESLFAQSDVKYNPIGMGWGNASRCSKSHQEIYEVDQRALQVRAFGPALPLYL